MGIIARLIRLCKADLHGVMDLMEDRDLLLKQYLREMEDALTEKQAHLEQLKAREGQIANERAAGLDRMGALEDDIALAVAREKDDIARLLIRKLHPLRQGAEDLEAHRVRLAEDIQTLQACCERQARAYARIRQRTAAVAHHRLTYTEMTPGHTEAALWRSEPRAEEIELELLQRKEAQRAGRSV